MGQKKSAVLVGRMASAFGIKGWIKISSYTSPLENIFLYTPWQLRQIGSGEISRSVELIEGKPHGKGLVAKFAGVDDRDQADSLKGLEIVVDRSQLPEPEEGLYYWADLVGLQVETAEGRSLGRVDQMLQAGAADVMLVCGEGNSRHMIPFIRDEVILTVDLDAGFIRVNWEQERD
jgi:16S rRNA processing protein RimM